ncbi:MAG: hypothetical protein AAF593_00645 [Planctomycetota bacterium]
MDAELREIVEQMTGRLKGWLDKPSPAREKVETIRRELADLKGQIGGSVIADTLKSLERADAQAQRARQREAAEAIAELCREHGVIVEAKEPPKRKRRAAKPEQKPEPTQ